MAHAVKNSEPLYYCPGGMEASERLKKAVGFSIAFHAVLLLCVGWLNHSAVRTERPLIIDLSLSGASSTVRDMAPFSRAPDVQPFAPVKQLPRVKGRVSREPETAAEQPLAQPVDEATKAMPQSTAGQGRSDAPGQPVVSAHGTEGSGSRSPRDGVSGEKSGGQGSSSRALEQTRYLKEHFVYIKDLVQKQVYYPVIARNMGWEGRVVVSFMISHDGTAKEVKVIESRSAEVLNRSAVEAVKRTSPFPRPPAEAQIVLPIEFRLH